MSKGSDSGRGLEMWITLSRQNQQALVTSEIWEWIPAFWFGCLHDWRFINLEKYRRVSTLGVGGDIRHINRFTCGTPSLRENWRWSLTMSSDVTSFPREVVWNYRKNVDLEIRIRFQLQFWHLPVWWNWLVTLSLGLFPHLCKCG